MVQAGGIMKQETRGFFSKEDTLAVKGIAIILMFYHHCFLSAERFEGYEVSFFPLPETMGIALSHFCKICVAMFVFLSAYGMTVTIKRAFAEEEVSAGRWEEFVMKRYLKLMSGYVFCFMTAVAASALLRPEMLKIYTCGWKGLWTFLLDLSGLAYFFGADTLVGTWWYMGLAIAMIFAMPLLWQLYKKLGGVFVILALLMPPFFGIAQNDYWRYLFCIAIGIIAADRDLLVRSAGAVFFGNEKVNFGFKFLTGVALCVLCFFFRRMSGATDYYFLLDGVISFVVIAFCNAFVIHVKGLRQVLMFLGKHSMNMFLLHTLIRVKFFQDFTYSFQSAWLILLVLLIDSLLVSIVVEWLKKVTGYQKLTERMYYGKR